MSLCTYECRVVPGLLQTEAYARAVSLSLPPLPDPVELEERISARLARQKLLSVERRPPTAFGFIVEEAVPRRQTGGPDSKDRQGPQLTLSPTAWAGFVAYTPGT